MKILVTGSEGNIGQLLVPYLEKYHIVFGTDIVQNFKDNYKTTDINNGADLAEIFHKFLPDIVIHLAGMVSRVTCEYSPVSTINTNISGAANIIYLCKQIGAKLMFFSTSEIYGNTGGLLTEDRKDLKPNNIYGLSKLLCEQLIEYEVTNGLQAIIVRPFMFYHETETIGNHRSAIIRFSSSLLNNIPVTVHRNSFRSWMHLDEAVIVIERLCYINRFVTVNIGNPEITSTQKLAEKICKNLFLNPDNYINLVDLPGKMTLTKAADFKLQYELTGYKCQINIDEGIKRVLDYLKKYYDYLDNTNRRTS